MTAPAPTISNSGAAAEFALAGAEEFEFRPGRDEAFDGGQHLDEVRPVRCDQPGADCVRRYWSWCPASVTETSKRRFSSASSGRTTERFSFRL